MRKCLPEVVVAISAMGLSSAANLWAYFLANLAGGAVAGLAFRFINPGDV